MYNNSKLKLFISYSHLDEKEVKEFIKFLAPQKLKDLRKNKKYVNKISVKSHRIYVKDELEYKKGIC